MGVSFDAPPQNKLFSENNEFQYPLWTDQQKELALHYGAANSPTAFIAARVTVVLDATGHAVLSYEPTGDLSEHPAKVLEDCQKIFPTE